jgi:WD40 repeat protein
VIPISGGKITRVAYSSSNRYIAWALGDGSLQIWNVGEGRIEQDLSLNLSGDNDAVISLAFSPLDDKRIAWTTQNGYRIYARDWTTPSVQLKTSIIHANRIMGIAFSPDRNQIITVSNRLGTVAVHDATTLDLTRGSVTGDVHWAKLVACSSSGSRIASVSEFSTAILIYDARTGSYEKEMQVNIQNGAVIDLGAVMAVALSSDGKLLVSGSFLGAVQLWDVEKGVMRGEKRFEENVHSVAFSPDAQYIAAGFGDGTLRMLNTALNIQWSFKPHSSPVDFLAFSSDSSRLVSASDTRICVSDTKVVH